MKILQSTWAASGIGALLFLLTTALLLRPERLSPTVPTTGAPSEPSPATANPWDYVNPEVDGLIAELRKERETLNLREQHLNELELRLKSERDEINQVTQAVHQLQIEFDSVLLRVKEEETANLKKLAKLYASMSPEGAATVLKEMTVDQVAKMLAFMKESESAPILEALAQLGGEEPKRVAAITERLRVSTQPPKTPAPKAP